MKRFPSRGIARDMRRSARPRSIVGLLGLVVLTLVSCTSNPSRTSVTPSPHLAAGQTGVFASIGEVSKGETPPVATHGKLVALAATDGTPVWSTPTSGIAISELVANGTLFTSTEQIPPTPTTSAPPSTVEALRASDGTRLWQTAAATFATPVAADASAVYVLARDPHGQQGQLQALRVADGQSLWKDSLPGVPLGFPASAVTLDNGTLFFVTIPQSFEQTANSTVTAVRASDGKMVWSVPLPGQFGAATEKNGTVYVSGNAVAVTGPTRPLPGPPTMLALRASDGTQLWSHPLIPQGFAESLTQPILSGSAVCVALTVQSVNPTGPGVSPVTAFLIGLNPATGAQLWQTTTSGYGASLVGDDTAVYVSSIDQSTPATKPVGGAPPSTPASSLTAFRANDGKQLWTQPHPEGSVRAAAIAGATLITLVVSGSSSTQITGSVEALSTSDGSKQWTYTVANGGPAAVAVGTV